MNKKCLPRRQSVNSSLDFSFRSIMSAKRTADIFCSMTRTRFLWPTIGDLKYLFPTNKKEASAALSSDVGNYLVNSSPFRRSSINTVRFNKKPETWRSLVGALNSFACDPRYNPWDMSQFMCYPFSQIDGKENRTILKECFIMLK